MKRQRLYSLISVTAVLLLMAACGGRLADDDLANIEESLEMESGGFDMEDELPMFGRADLDELPIEPIIEVPEEPGLDPYTGVQPQKQPQPQKQAQPQKQPQPQKQAQPQKQPLPPKPPLCPQGFVKGLWTPLKPDMGIFVGKWTDLKGLVQGHVMGIWGRNLLGHGVLFGKYVDKQGHFRGLIKGRYGNGYFRARWYGLYGLKGEVHGVYAKGVFKGKWRMFCPLCKVLCKPGFKPVPAPTYKCICVPIKVLPCKKGQCPKGMYCDFCPAPCPPGKICPSVCAPPICKPLPPPKPAPKPTPKPAP